MHDLVSTKNTIMLKPLYNIGQIKLPLKHNVWRSLRGIWSFSKSSVNNCILKQNSNTQN